MAEDIRMARLNDQLKKSAMKPRALTDKEEWERKQQGFETDDDDDDDDKEDEAGGGESSSSAAATTGMQVEQAEEGGGEKPKISTSGPRVSRREAYRSSKGFTVKQTPTTLFTARGQKKRQGCKPKRRRG